MVPRPWISSRSDSGGAYGGWKPNPALAREWLCRRTPSAAAASVFHGLPYGRRQREETRSIAAPPCILEKRAGRNQGAAVVMRRLPRDGQRHHAHGRGL